MPRHRPRPVTREDGDDAAIVAHARTVEVNTDDYVRAVQQTVQPAIAKAEQELAQTQHATLEFALNTRAHEAQKAEHAMHQARMAGDVDGEIAARLELQQIHEDRQTIQAGIDALLGNDPDEATPQVVRDGNVIRQAAPQAPLQPQNIEQALQQLPQLQPGERDWLRAHPDALMDPRARPILEVTYAEAERKGIARGTPEYFDLFEDRLGYKAAQPREAAPDDEPAPRHAAPVARSSGGSVERTGGRRVREGQVMLNEAQREAAKASGISEVEYAKQVVKLRELKRAGMYQ